MNNLQTIVPLVEANISEWPAHSRVVVALSGGADSVCLLHLLKTKASQHKEITAIHFDHGLTAQHNVFRQVCRANCDELDITLIVIDIAIEIKIAIDSGASSVEEVARDLRYKHLASYMERFDHTSQSHGNNQEGNKEGNKDTEKASMIVVTAHHEDDQAETVLLQLMRGAGPEGLSAMPTIRRFSSGYLARPLLNINKRTIRDYITYYELNCIEDLGNRNLLFKRNVIRHRISPILDDEFPGWVKALNRVARLQANASEVIEKLAYGNLKECMDTDTKSLDINLLQGLSDMRLSSVLRVWLKLFIERLPSESILQQIISGVVYAKADAQPLITWSNYEVRRHRNNMYFMYALDEQALRCDEIKKNWQWKPSSALTLPTGKLTAIRQCGTGLDPDKHYIVRYRKNGERYISDGNVERRLKRLWQEYNVPHWMRYRLPLIYHQNELVAIPNIWVSNRIEVKAERAVNPVFELVNEKF